MDLLEVAEDRALSGVALSRATWLHRTDRPPQAIEVPVIAGRTVWDVIDDPLRHLIVVEEPNYFGRLETQAPVGDNVITISRGRKDSASLGDTRHLVASLRQVPGLQFPHGQPESAAFIVSLPKSASHVADLLSDAGFPGCTALGHSFPEFPGGMHIQVAWPQHDNAHFCTIVRSTI